MANHLGITGVTKSILLYLEQSVVMHRQACFKLDLDLVEFLDSTE